jgi:hypothetical protein
MKACDLQFVCGKQWGQLEPTALANARYCGDCRKAVFMVKTRHQLHVASALGRCVGIADDNDFIGVIGDPVALGEFDWMEDDYFENAVVNLAMFPTPDRVAQLRMLFPKLFDGDKNEIALLSGATVSIGNLCRKDREQLASEFGEFAPELKMRSMV